MKTSAGIKYIIGVDEAGRGPLAGPVAVGACLVPVEMTRKGLLSMVAKSGKKELKKLKDSKKLSEKAREVWFAKMGEMQQQTQMQTEARKQTKVRIQKSAKQKPAKNTILDFSVTLISNKIIDEQGISFAIRKAIAICLKKIQKRKQGQRPIRPSQCLILLDGGLRAPAEYIFQKTIIRGDEKEFPISLASIAAKVTRDRHMKKIAKKYPAYGFEIHKGYGTARHIAVIRKEGITSIHRTSFLKKHCLNLRQI